MNLKQTLVLVALTIIYLAFEMAFNARLLDVVGGAATKDQIHNIEIFGRCLSGIAVALVVFQLRLRKRNKSGGNSPSGFAIFLVCLAAAALTYFAIQKVVETLVERSSSSFRHASLNIILVQRALVDGGAELDGLEGGKDVFAKPEGKAFLALFPVMAVAVERLDEKIRDAKLQLIARQVDQRLGGVKSYYKSYVRAVNDTKRKWGAYSGAPGASDMSAEIKRRQDSAWQDYLSKLGRRGWTPSTVPRNARNSVVKQVRTRVSVPRDWNPSDEQTFRNVVASQAQKRTGDGSVTVKGIRIPAGLGFAAFFAQPVIQDELRSEMKFAKGLVLQTSYASANDFMRLVFQPTVHDLSKQELQHYDEPVSTYEDWGKNAERGIDAARAAIVPPVALLFSLSGAVFHFAKLCYLLVTTSAMMMFKNGHKMHFLWVFGLVVCGVFLSLAFMENQVTQSKLFGYMREQIMSANADGYFGAPLVRVLQVVAVGQGFFYPINEHIRNEYLMGVTYGYEPNKK